MSDIQKILIALANELTFRDMTVSGIIRLAHALDGVHDIYHVNIVKSAFGIKEDEDA